MSHLPDVFTPTDPAVKPLISRDLLTRIATSLVVLPLVAGAVIAGGIPFAVLVTLMSAIGALEYAAMAARATFRPSVGAAVMLAAALTLTIGLGWTAVALGVAVVGVSAVLWLERGSRGADARSAPIMAALALFMGVVGGFALLIRAHPAGLLWWLLIAGGTWGMDILSYVGGRLYGRTPLAPRLSPKKTTEGALTGAAASIVIMLVFLGQAGALMPATLVLCLLTPGVALCGDLFESAVKRHFGVKDSHAPGFDVLPGHGGVADRIDGLMFVTLLYAVGIALAF